MLDDVEGASIALKIVVEVVYFLLMEVLVVDFFCAAWDIMNQARPKVGMAVWEDCHFHEHFYMPFAIIQMVWDMLEGGGLLPKKSKPKHLLWTLYICFGHSICFEVLSKGGPQLHCLWRVEGCYRPQDDVQVGLALPC